MIIEAKKSQDPQLVGKLETQESGWCKFQSERWQAADPRRADVSVCTQRQEKTDIPSQPVSQELFREDQSFCSVQAFN